MRQQINEIEVVQHSMKRQLNELQSHRFNDRLRNVEIQQNHLANANFNLSRQISNLDKLHGSMLELLEDVEAVQNKVDKSFPEIKTEISKLEFNSAQLASEENLIREEGHNAAKSIQAMAVSISTLQEDRDRLKGEDLKKLEAQIAELQREMAEIKSTSHVHKSMAQNLMNKVSNSTLS
jgi:chromosome segregation ATPase